MGNTVLVTGATGNVGRHVVTSLQALGEPVRAAIQEGTKASARELLGESVELAGFDFYHPGTIREALDGVDRLFLIRPPAIADVKSYVNPVVDFAIDAGVKQIVFLSLMGIERARTAPHYKVEQYILNRDVPYTFLRPSFFMQNLNTFYRDEIRERDEIFLPAGKGKTSFIDTRDIGAVAARVFTSEDHHNRAYTLTGSEALDYFDVAEIFSEVLGREITYANPNPWAYRRRMKARGISPEFVKVMQGLYFVVRMGWSDTVTDDVERLLSRPPITMREYVQDYAECWQREREPVK